MRQPEHEGTAMGVGTLALRGAAIVTAVVALSSLVGCAATTALAGGAHTAGNAFRDCPTCPEMVVVPAGSFTMGSPASEAMRDPDEMQHKVTFARPFAVSKFPVTWDQWEACVRDGACEGHEVEIALHSGPDGKWNKDYVDHGRGTRPVVGVSWYDAQVFAGWLNKKTGKDAYRLVSESEFEYAARAGTTAAYPWGEAPDHDYANFGKSSGKGLGGETGGRDVWLNDTSPAGSFPANAFGLHDMLGNVYQWVEDCYEPNAELLPKDGSAMKSGNCAVRVMRSTSFMSNPHTLRSANRAGQYSPTLRGRNYLGFRVAKTLD
jgi:formylglycine-generating enzyme required for sulfatase activity